MATELVKGKSIDEAMELTNKAVVEALGGLPPQKIHCSVLAEEAIYAALSDYCKKNGRPLPEKKCSGCCGSCGAHNHEHDEESK